MYNKAGVYDAGFIIAEFPEKNHVEVNMTDNNESALIFVYNADSGLFNTLTDIAHKTLSPKTYTCNLCAITHGLFTERAEWKDFIEHLGTAVEFLHRDEFEHQYPDISLGYPAILKQSGNRQEEIIDSGEINRCKCIEDLQKLVKRHLD